jgi:hypothetical protein
VSDSAIYHSLRIGRGSMHPQAHVRKAGYTST